MSVYMTSERLADIEARLERDGRVVAAELARIYATSEDTIRRDLRALAAEGRCRRVYGGALPATPVAGAGQRAGADRAGGEGGARGGAGAAGRAGDDGLHRRGQHHAGLRRAAGRSAG